MKNAPVLHAVEFGLFSLLQGLVRLLPHSAARRLGHALGSFAYRVMGKRRRIALANLELAMPELAATERTRIARGAFRQMISQATELLSWTRYAPRELCRRWTLEGWEHIDAAAASGRPVFFMTAHFGHWELVGRPLSLYASPVCALVRPLDNPRLDHFVNSQRTAHGLTIVRKHGAARELVRRIREGSRLLVLIDQRVKPIDAVEVPFFGQPALAPNMISRLALKSDALVVPIFVYPAAGNGYRIVARPGIEPATAADDAVAESTTRYLAAVEHEIRQRPELWLWMHDRWRLP